MSKKIKIGKIGQRKNINLFDFTDNLPTTYSKGAHIELFSNKYVFVEHCMGIFEYSDTIIKLNIGQGSVTFIGNEMEITALEGKNLTIKGIVSSIQYD